MKIKICFLVGSLILISSCGLKSSRGKKDPSPEKEKQTEEIVTGRGEIMSSNQIELGKISCTALKNRIEKLKTLQLGKEFSYKLNSRYCPPDSANVPDTAVFRVSKVDNRFKLEIVSNYSGPYFDEIITDQEATLAYFCPKLNSATGDPIADYIDDSATERRKIKFSGTNTSPLIEVYYFVKRNGIDFFLDRKMTLTVDVNKGDLEGNILEHTVLTACLNLKDYWEFKQTFNP